MTITFLNKGQEQMQDSKDDDSHEATLAAVQQRGRALQHIPEILQREQPEIALAAFRRNRRSTLQFVPEALRTPELCLTAVQEDGRAL